MPGGRSGLCCQGARWQVLVAAGATLNDRSGVTQTILVVDDEAMARTLLRLVLARGGFQVREAEDGYDALRKVEAELPDLVLLDVMMPGLDGFEVCTALRGAEKTAVLPILMLSAKTDPASINKGLQVGATSYLTKPLPPDELLDAIHAALANRPS
jgi:DNA-binding response OmpR family regulator